MSMSNQQLVEVGYPILAEAIHGYFGMQEEFAELGSEKVDVYVEYEDVVYSYANRKSELLEAEFGLFWLIHDFDESLLRDTVKSGLQAAHKFLAEEGVV